MNLLLPDVLVFTVTHCWWITPVRSSRAYQYYSLYPTPTPIRRAVQLQQATLKWIPLSIFLLFISLTWFNGLAANDFYLFIFKAHITTDRKSTRLLSKMSSWWMHRGPYCLRNAHFMCVFVAVIKLSLAQRRENEVMERGEENKGTTNKKKNF